jgi:hypothetical protein
MSPHDADPPAPRRVRIDPQLVFGATLVLALAINWSGFSGAMHGAVDIVALGARFLVTVALVWAALFAVASMIAGFAATPPPAADGDGRRASDRVPAPRALEADPAAAGTDALTG